MRFDAPRRNYGGNVIDGPWRGKQVIKPYPDFRIDIVPVKSVLDFDPNELVSDTISYTRVTYRWSFSLGEWCMVY